MGPRASDFAHPGPQVATRYDQLAAVPARAALERVAYALFALFVFFGSFLFMEPSPYDFVAIPAVALWVFLGIRLHRATLVYVGLLLIWKIAIVIALLPYLAEKDPVTWTISSIFLMVTGLFFVMFFSDETERRVELAFKAFLASCLVAAITGTLGYFDVAGTGSIFAMYENRASGTFKDPNMLGSFLPLGALYLMHNLLTGNTRRTLLSLVGLGAVLLGILLSLSRGSWGGTILAIMLMVGLTYVTTRIPGVRRRIARLAVLTLAASVVGIAGLLSIDEVRENIADRFTVAKDYDQGETGRFGNQRRSIPMLVEEPMGFGPLRFRLRFEIEPHNSYIGGFANGGWLGGFAFLGLVLTTSYVAMRLCLLPSPYQRHAQIAWPALFMLFVQAVQIDVDHWRHFYMLMGLIWALEAARQRWLAHGGSVGMRWPS